MWASYRWEGYGTRVSYKFPVFRIYEGDEEALKASENPLGIVSLDWIAKTDIVDPRVADIIGFHWLGIVIIDGVHGVQGAVGMNL